MAVTRPSTFGTQLRRHREAAGLSQEDLAERAGLAAKAIGALERGERRRPHPRTVQLLSDALGLDEERRHAFIALVPRSVPSFSRETTFVGRGPEFARLRARFAESAAGRGGFAVLVGEAGIGKTRLAREFAQAVTAEGAMVLSGQCFDGEWQPPFGPWVEALTVYLRSCSPESLRRELGSVGPYIAQLVPEIRASLSDFTAPSPLTPDDERLRLYDAIARLIHTISLERPVLVFLDDLHWADPDSLRVLRHLGRSLKETRTLVLGTYREPELGVTAEHPLLTTLNALRRDGAYEQVRLHGLSSSEVFSYVAQLAGRAVPRAVVEVIESEAGGNPFYAQELFRHLAQDASVFSAPNGSEELRIETLGIPEGVREIVGHRVGTLSPNAARLVTCATGFGVGLTFDLLQAVTGFDENEVLDCIDEALEAGLLRVAQRDRPTYEFAHALVRHALYERMSVDRRIRLHRRIAAALELLYAGHEMEKAAELAAQYHASAQLPGASRGLRFALAAAAQARAAFAHDRAATFLRMACDLAAESSIADRAEILRLLAVAQAESVRLEDARRTADHADEAMRVAGSSPRVRAEFLATMAWALKDGGATSALWEPLIEHGLSLTEGRDLLWARLTLLRDNYAGVRSGPIGTGRWLGQDPEAVAIARASGDESDYARTLEPLEWRSRRETDAIHAHIRRWTQPIAIMRGLEVVVRDRLYRQGAFREAGIAAGELLAAGERFGSSSAKGEALVQHAVAHASVGDLALAQETLARAQEIVGRLGPSHRLHFVSTGLKVGIAYFIDGEWHGLAETTAGYATAADVERRPLGTIATAYTALCSARAGKREDALSWIRHLTRAAEKVPVMTLAHSITVVVAAATIWELDATEHAAIYLRLLTDLQRAGLGDPPAFGPLDLAIARMVALSGSTDEANERFHLARKKIELLGHAPLGAVADYDRTRAMIRWGVIDPSEEPAHVKRAVDAFRSLGMHGWANRASLPVVAHGARTKDQ